MRSPRILRLETLPPADLAQVRDLHRRALVEDGVAALSEQTLLALDQPSGRVVHVLGYAGEQLGGYAQLTDPADRDSASAELVVDPAQRRQGLGRALVDDVLDQSGHTRMWAHGNLEAARCLAASAGLDAVRELHKMSRPLEPSDVGSPDAALPDGYVVRAFEPGRDEDAWLAANSAAFVHHPEQGRLTRADLEERMAQPWFDPAGLLLVVAQDSPDDVVAFHWTKVDPEQRSTLDPAATAGEVYVVGVHPAYQGRGLGRPVTALGLAHLAALGLPEVVLYVDGDNPAALQTYTRLGFRSIMVDVMYSRVVHLALSG